MYCKGVDECYVYGAKVIPDYILHKNKYEVNSVLSDTNSAV